MGYDFNLKITDFGAAKLLDIEDEPSQLDNIDYKGIDIQNSNNEPRKGSFVGTAEYVSPELLRDNVCGFEADVWALGCILYQFFHGVPPFKGATEYLTFEKIVHVNYSYRQNYPLPSGAVQIIDQILVDDIGKRLTIPQVKEMPWFQGIPWENKAYIWNRKVPRFEAYTPGGQSVNGSPIAVKKAVNKSASYQQLHAQIQNSSDYSFIPALGSAKRAYAPPTVIKKAPQMVAPNAPMQNFKPNTPPQQMHPYALQPQHQHHIQQPQQHQNYQTPPKAHGIQHTQNNPSKLVTDSYGNQISQQAKNTVRKDVQSPLAGPPSPQKPGSKNVRQNTVFATSTSNQNPAPNLQKPLPPIDQLRVSENNKTIQPPANPKVPVLQPTSNQPTAPVRKSAAAAAAAAGAVQHPYQQLKQNVIPVRTSISKNIKLKEISSLLEANEKILKLDVILKLDLSHKLVRRKANEPLGDTSIEAIIKKHKSELRSLAKPVITVITNHARVLFIDSHLQVMLIDLKANQGADYLMYDYEFETLLLSDDEEETLPDVEANGYLILELNKEGGDLIFLKRILADTKLKETVMVVDKNGKELVLGDNIGWIDCLLLAKDIIQNTPKTQEKSSKSGTPSPTSTPKTKNSSSSTIIKRASMSKPSNPDAKKSKTPLVKSPRMAQSSSNASSNSLGSSMSKFAYAAAAAAHKY